MNNSSSSALPKISRDLSIDILKAIAIFGVIIIHTCSYNYEIASVNWITSVFWGSAARASVPIFFMCSGALLLAPRKNFSTKRFFKKKVLRILVAMLFWAMAYKVFHLLVGHNLSIANIFQSFKEVLLFNQEFHLYFLQIILIVYLFLPITKIITEHATKRQLEYSLVLWFALGIVFPTVYIYWPFTLLSDIPMQYKISMTYSAIGYGLLGYYLKQYPLQNRKGYTVLTIIGFLITFGGTYISSSRQGVLDPHFLEGMSVGVCILAAGIFGICISAKSPENKIIRKSAVYLSKASFCIFLTHLFFIYALSSLGITAAILPTAVSIPLVAIIILICSTLTYEVLSRIPIVNEWLI